MDNTFLAPKSVVESWPAPNHINPVTTGNSIIVVVALMASVSTFVVAARLYSRFFLTKAPGIDDVFIVIGWAFAVALGSQIIIGHTKYESGRHIWDIQPSTFSGHRLNIWISEWLYLIASACIKCSVLLFYLRLSVSFSRSFYVAAILGIVYNVGILLAFTIYLLLICQPILSYWMAFDPGWAATHKFKCGNESVSIPLSAALNAFGDFYTTLLPLLVAEKTARSQRQKIALYCLFGLGFLSMGAAMARTYYLDKIVNRDYDFTWPLTPMWMTSMFEFLFAIIAASAPALKPFFRQFFASNATRAAISHKTYRSGTTSTSTSPVSVHQNHQQWATIGLPKPIPPNITRLDDIEEQVPAPIALRRTKSAASGTWIDMDTSDDEDIERYEMQRTRLSDTTFDRLYPRQEIRTPEIRFETIVNHIQERRYTGHPKPWRVPLVLIQERKD